MKKEKIILIISIVFKWMMNDFYARFETYDFVE
jgi:hypothetical protein